MLKINILKIFTHTDSYADQSSLSMCRATLYTQILIVRIQENKK
jgi:hypothetical protein